MVIKTSSRNIIVFSSLRAENRLRFICIQSRAQKANPKWCSIARASYREDQRLGVRSGNALLQLRASDLLELAEDRLVELKAARIVAAQREEAEVIGRRTGGNTPVERMVPPNTYVFTF